MIVWPLKGGDKVTFTSEHTYQMVIHEGTVVSSHRRRGSLASTPLESEALPGDEDRDSLCLNAPIGVIPPRSTQSRPSRLLRTAQRIDDRLILEATFGQRRKEGGVVLHFAKFDSKVDGELSEDILDALAWGRGLEGFGPGAIFPEGSQHWRR